MPVPLPQGSAAVRPVQFTVRVPSPGWVTVTGQHRGRTLGVCLSVPGRGAADASPVLHRWSSSVSSPPPSAERDC